MVDSKQIDLAMKVGGMVILAVIILFLLTWSGFVKCNAIPYWCNIYESVMGGPRVLIVYGDDGMGDPSLLKDIMQDPQQVGVQAVDLAHIDRVSISNLKNYKLVIVDHCQKVTLDQLSMFMAYVNQNGGRLVWTGDAGTVKGDDEVTNFSDINALAKVADNAWVRVKETETDFEVVNFDQFLGARYVNSFCNLTDCKPQKSSVGILKTETTGNHPLIFGASPALQLKIVKDHPFAVVRPFANASNSNVVLSLEFGSVVVAKGITLPKSIPMIMTAGFGERVAYYAYPPEYYVQDNNYYTFMKNMYYGMLGK